MTAESATFSKDMIVLRRRVQDYESHIKRLKVFVDSEDTDNLVKELRNQKQNNMDLGKLADEIHGIEVEVADARRLKFRP